MNEESAVEQIRKGLRTGWRHWAGLAIAICMTLWVLGYSLKVEGRLEAEFSDPKLSKDLHSAVYESVMRDAHVLAIAKVFTTAMLFSAFLGLLIGGVVWSFHARRKDRLLASLWDRLKALESRLPPPAA